MMNKISLSCTRTSLRLLRNRILCTFKNTIPELLIKHSTYTFELGNIYDQRCKIEKTLVQDKTWSNIHTCSTNNISIPSDNFTQSENSLLLLLIVLCSVFFDMHRPWESSSSLFDFFTVASQISGIFHTILEFNRYITQLVKM